MKRYKIWLCASLTIALLFLVSGQSYSSDRLLFENFDDKSLNDTPLIAEEGGSSRPLSAGSDYTWAPGRDGSGYSIFFRMSDSRDSTLIWIKNVPSPWPSDEMYVSFWMRYPEYIKVENHENMKIFYPHWDGTSSYVHYALSNSSGVYYSANGKGEILTNGNWLGASNQTDGNWHHYEFYIKFSEGISRFWYDGSLKVDDNFGSGHWSNKVYYIAAPSIDATEVSNFSRQIDDWEVWDGMPDQQPPEPPNIPNPPAGLRIVSSN